MATTNGTGGRGGGVRWKQRRGGGNQTKGRWVVNVAGIGGWAALTGVLPRVPPALYVYMRSFNSCHVVFHQIIGCSEGLLGEEG